MANNNHFDLTLDTLAPSGSITREHININANENLTIVKGDATYMKVWFNSTAVGTKSDAGYTSGTWEAAATSKMTAFSAAGDYYYHLVLMDDVNNESQVYNTDKIVFDPDAPVASNFWMADPDAPYSHTITNNKTGILVHFDFTDDPESHGTGVSGVVAADITGADINPIHLTIDPTHTDYDGTLDFVAGVQDGTKTITLVLTDAAGNTSTALNASITLDTQLDVPVIALETTGGEALPAYVNYTSINISLTDADTGIVGYKVWMGTDADEPTDWTDVTMGALDVDIPTTLTGNDGTKTFHAKVLDQAGSVATATPKSVILDTANPTNVGISSDVSIISNVSGNNTATLTLTGTDNLGIASYNLSCGATSILSGNVDNDHPLPSSFSLTSANAMVEGSNTLTWTVTDNAGNSASDTCTVILDTTAPTASISSLNTWYNDEFDISVTTTDANTVSQIWVWTSTTESDTSVPGDCNPLNVSAGVTQVDHSNIAWHNAQSASNYMHVKVVDSVGNIGYADAAVFGFDNVVPDTPTISFSQSAYISTSASATIQYSSDTSGVAYMRVTGDITNPTANDAWEAISSPRAVTLTSGDGSKSIYVQVKDAAGNVSALSTAAICELDTTDPTASLVLYEADNQTAKPSVSPLATFTARITITDVPATGGTDSDPKTYYKLWGDFTTGGSSEPAEWTEFTPDSGQVYESVTGLSCTSGDGLKTMRLKVKDSAGHTLETIIASFTYDTEAPTVDVTNVDYNIVSKVHELRRTSSGPVEGKYSDECRFLITPDEIIQAWKVCAYADQTAAEGGSASDTAIPMTAGSVNMSGTTNSDNAISCTLKGADYETALGGTGHDGAHIVVVYVQDQGGTWSAVADFTPEISGN